jgi:polysaccharide biosynthesis/export protein
MRGLGRAVVRHLAMLFVVVPVLGISTTARAAEAGEVPDAREYRISAEDVLQISVWKEEGLEKTVVVRPDGGVSFPLAGDVPAAGKTPLELETEIASRLQRFIPDAVVTVSVMELKGLRIYVSGKVKTPGQFTVGRYVDVLQAITLAGGLTPYANESGIKILRREGGKEVVYEFNYGDVKDGKNLKQNIVLQTDDVVVVP